MIIDNRHITRIQGTWDLPASKSLSHRYLITQALSEIDFNLQNISDSNDTKILIENLSKKDASFYFFNDAGTPSRLFIAYAALIGLSCVIDGNDELSKRPFKPLVEALQRLGAEFEFLGDEYSLPLKLVKKVNLTKHEVSIDNTMSSQYVSALMLIAPYFNEGLTIHLTDQLSSFSYIEMTKDVMNKCGVVVELNKQKIKVYKGNYIKPLNSCIESDWSAASYPLMYAEVLDEVDLFLPNLSLNSIQGDKKIHGFFNSIEFKEENNGLRILKKKVFPKIHYDFDVINCPDLFPTLLAVLCFKKLNFKIKGIQNLKYKESDRVKSMKENLTGIVELIEDVKENEISSKSFYDDKKEMLKINSFKDHRIAMAMSLFSLKYPIELDDKNVVNKSFPNFWEKLKNVLTNN